MPKLLVDTAYALVGQLSWFLDAHMESVVKAQGGTVFLPKSEKFAQAVLPESVREAEQLLHSGKDTACVN